MQAFTHLRALAAPLEGRNVDTDQIIPARFLKKNRDEFYKNYLFHDLRFDEHGAPRPDFILNRPPFQGAQILVADENFGCGSSREGAVYCLADYGIRAILAPSFGDIFFNNCLKNGLLPVRLDAKVLAAIRQTLLNSTQTNDSARDITIDLAACTVKAPGLNAPQIFTMDPFWHECLLKGVDELALTLSYASDIENFERQHHNAHPWLAS
jgi:3-isopropylmalate/(R)-2-methylmalate dehydratase small subunit